MSSTAQLLERVRPHLGLLVEAERVQVGSKMLAYAKIAHALGRSSSWLQNVLGRQGRVGLSAETADRLRALCGYDALCERIEASSARLRERASELRGNAHAAAAGTAGVAWGGGGLDQGDVRPSADLAAIVDAEGER